MSEESLIPIEKIEQKIYVVRGERVMLDSDLAEIYGVTTKRFNEQVKRNLKRFPEDFMFQLTAEEDEHLRSQIATSKKNRGGRRYLPYVFTEHAAPAGGECFEQRQSRRSERAGHSPCASNCGKCFSQTRNWRKRSKRSNKNTTRISKSCSTRLEN